MHRPEQHPAVARLLARLPRGLPDAARRGRAHVLLTAVVRHGALHVRPECAPQSCIDRTSLEHPTLSTIEGPLFCASLSHSLPVCLCYTTVGGALGRVEIHLIAHPDDDQREARRRLTEQFASFDAAKAQCFLAKDREQLRAVIEAGFGDFDDFNRIARSLLVRRVLPRRDSGSWSSLVELSSSSDRSARNAV